MDIRSRGKAAPCQDASSEARIARRVLVCRKSKPQKSENQEVDCKSPRDTAPSTKPPERSALPREHDAGLPCHKIERKADPSPSHSKFAHPIELNRCCSRSPKSEWQSPSPRRQRSRRLLRQQPYRRGLATRTRCRERSR